MTSSANANETASLTNLRGMEDLPEFDCESLGGRLREICRGETDLALFGEGNTVEAYRKLWRNENLDFACPHRGAITRRELCHLCGNRDTEVPVYSCVLHGECTVHAHGIKGTSGKLAVCIACDDNPIHQPNQRMNGDGGAGGAGGPK